jgi:hypothetical protein
MTTYQDPPLQSRRAVRQGERVEQSTPPFAPPQLPRTAAGAGEPLSYVTQNRPPLPGYDEPASRGRRSVEPATPATPAPAAAPDAPPAFRPRDFSPEARTPPPAWAPEYDRESGVVDYRTQARAQAIPGGGSSLAASLASEPSEHTLTRRELRAVRAASGLEPAPAEVAPQAPVAPAAYAAPVPLVAPPAPQYAPAPTPSTQLDSAMAEFDALAARSSTAQATSSPTRRAGRRAAAQPDLEPTAAPLPVAPVAAPPVVAQQYEAPTPAVALPPEPAAVAPTTGERPIGHWTTQSDLDDQTQVTESTISRRVGSGAITTSALVLPSIPGHNMSTGEVMLTDSISLPSALAATGAHHSIDETDIDHLLDPGDHQLVNTDSVPIRAIRAVSSHTSSRNVITTAAPARGSRALTALIVSASGMVVVVVTLLVVALATEVI